RAGRAVKPTGLHKVDQAIAAGRHSEGVVVLRGGKGRSVVWLDDADEAGQPVVGVGARVIIEIGRGKHGSEPFIVGSLKNQVGFAVADVDGFACWVRVES